MFGKMGIGKSVIGNLIFGNNFFKLLVLGLLIFSECFFKCVIWFDWKILIVDIFGIFDIFKNNEFI